LKGGDSSGGLKTNSERPKVGGYEKSKRGLEKNLGEVKKSTEVASRGMEITLWKPEDLGEKEKI